MFEVKWFTLKMNELDTKRNVIEHATGFTMVSTRTIEPIIELYVLLSKCE